MNFHTQNRDQIMYNSASSKSSFHWRSDSGELDVFEAARYFSAANEHLPRRSLDVPIMRSNPNNIPCSDYQKQPMKEQNKKFKQPSSPGGRLASFLNSLFNQTPLKKKKKKQKKSSKSDFEEESPGGGRRKRRSSISHFRITSTSKNNANAASGFRSPPPFAITPTKSYKELARFADRHQPPMKEGSLKHSLEKLRVSEKINGLNLRKLSEEEEEDGGESDSSSDLFDLPNHELDFFSSSLPVYETTRMETITIRTPLSTASLSSF